MSTAKIDEPRVETNGAADRDGMPVVKYSPSDAAIAEAREKFGGLTCETPAKYKETTEAIAVLRGWRVAVEKKRVALKADALAWGRKVDGEARRITGLIEEIETPLKARKQEVDDAKERAKREAEEAARLAEENRIKAERVAEEARLQAIRDELAAKQAAIDAQQAKIDEANREAEAKLKAEAERQREEAERKAAKIAAEQKIEADRLEKQRQELAAKEAAIEAARKAAEAAEAARLLKERLEKEAIEKAAAKAEADRQLAEKRRLAAEAEAARLEAMKPDVEKLHAFAKAIESLAPPVLKTDEGKFALQTAIQRLHYTAAELYKVGGPKS